MKCKDRPTYNPIFLGEPDDIVWGMAYHIGDNISIILFSPYSSFYVIKYFHMSVRLSLLSINSYCDCKNNIHTFLANLLCNDMHSGIFCFYPET